MPKCDRVARPVPIEFTPTPKSVSEFESAGAVARPPSRLRHPRIPTDSVSNPRVARNAKHGLDTDCGIALLLSGRIVRDCWMKRLLHPEVALGRPVRSRRA